MLFTLILLCFYPSHCKQPCSHRLAGAKAESLSRGMPIFRQFVLYNHSCILQKKSSSCRNVHSVVELKSAFSAFVSLITIQSCHQGRSEKFGRMLVSLVITLVCDITILTLPKNRLYHNASRPYIK
jgi:hypothetical protein